MLFLIKVLSEYLLLIFLPFGAIFPSRSLPDFLPVQTSLILFPSPLALTYFPYFSVPGYITCNSGGRYQTAVEASGHFKASMTWPVKVSEVAVTRTSPGSSHCLAHSLWEPPLSFRNQYWHLQLILSASPLICVQLLLSNGIVSSSIPNPFLTCLLINL